MVENDDLRKAKIWVYRRLSIKNYSTKEMTKKMVDHGFESTQITKVLNECQELGYINDEAWLESQVRGQLSRKKGPLAIKHHLYRKGVGKEESEEVLCRLDPEVLEQSIKNLLLGKYGKKNLKDPKEKQKVITGLLRRGFSYEMIKKFIDINDVDFLSN